jgi:hypothetical protein
MGFASFANPFGLKGFIEPFHILREYGYMIIENQSVFFMQRLAPKFEYFYFELFSLVILIFFVVLLVSKKALYYFAPFVLALTFVLLGFKMIRIIPVFALFSIPAVSDYLYKVQKMKGTNLLVPGVGFLLITFIPGHYFSVLDTNIGVGLLPGVNDSARFFSENQIKGPIFNNYDIGGYLIYHLYGQEKVFVDNRPESYSVAFFKEIYVPMQENEEKWHEVDQQYNFNVIYFYRRDATPWAQPFLIRRLQDENWAPVYVDDYVLIILKQNDQNRDIIQTHELPKSMFVVT